MATEIESLLEYVVNVGGSELIVTEGAPSAVRLAGRVCAVPDAPAIEFGTLREFLGSMEGDEGSMICGPWAGVKWRVRFFREALGPPFSARLWMNVRTLLRSGRRNPYSGWLAAVLA